MSDSREDKRSVKIPTTLLTSVAGVGLASYGISTDQGIEIAKWLQASLGPVGFVSFVFNIAQGVALYLTVKFFGNIMKNFRQDIKEAFAQIYHLTKEVRGTIEEFQEGMAKFRVLLAQKGYDENSIEMDTKPKTNLRIQRAPEKG